MDTITKLDVVNIEIKRETIPVPALSGYKQVGHTKARLFVRGPSGKIYAIDTPVELADEIQGLSTKRPTEK